MVYRPRFVLLYHAAVFVAGLTVLIGLSTTASLSPHLSELFIFLLLSITVKRAGFHVAPKVTHSLVGIVDVASLLIFGSAGGGWVAGLSAFTYLLFAYARMAGSTPGLALELAAFNFGLKALMAALGSAVYLWLGGAFAPAHLGVRDLGPIAALCLVWFALDHVGWGLAEAIEKGRAGVRDFATSVLKASVLVELLPLPLSALLAYLYLTLDLSVFLFVALGIVLASIAVQRAADLSQANLRREAELQTLNDYALALSAARLDEREIIDLVYRYASRVMDTSNFAISLVDERSGAVELALWFRAGIRQQPRRYRHMEGLAGWVAQQRSPLLVRDLSREVLPVQGLLHTARRTRSALFVPMTGTQKVLGIVSVQAEAPGRFTPEHERMLVSIAQQAALAIEQARAYRSAQYRATQLETIAQVSKRVAGIFDLADLMQFVVALVKVNFSFYHVDIYLRDGDVLVHHAGTEAEETAHAFVPIDNTSLIGTVAGSGEPLLVNDVSVEPRFRMDPAAPDTRAELIVPLSAEAKLLGVLEVQSNQVGVFQPGDLFMLQTLGDQVALAIQEAELFASVQAEAYISNALLQVAEAVGALGSVDEILQTIVDLTPLLVGIERMVILLADTASNTLAVRASYGVRADVAGAEATAPIPLDAIITPGAHPSPQAVYEIALPPELQQRWQMVAALVLPLVIRGTLLGAVCVDTVAALEPRRVQLLAGIANQTALAVESVQLESARDVRARLDQELEIARGIQSALIPERVPDVPGFEIAALWTPALQVAGDFYDFLPLVDGRWGITVADVADKGVPAALYMTLARTIIRSIGLGRATRRTPHQVLERANEIIVADARTDMFVTAFYAVLDPAAYNLCYASAGHCPPLILRAGDCSVEWLRGRGLPLGVLPVVDLEERELTLQSGDIVVFYTDGVTEAMDAGGELFGTERLARAVCDAQHKNADGVKQAVVAAVNSFGGGVEQVDDLTLVVLRRV